MTRLLNTSFFYLIAGLVGGLFYREFTKMQDFPEGQFTQLGLVHTHLLILGFIMFLIVLLLEKSFGLTRQGALFTWFFWLYNAGVVITAGMMVWHGSLTVLGKESNAMISGIAGLGHIAISAGVVMLYVTIRSAIRASAATPGNQVHAA